MSKLSYSSRFTNVNKYDETGSYTGIQIASKLNQKNGQDYKLLDAIDIDWNGAWLAVVGSYINNTEELLDAIDRIGELSDLTWINNTLNNLTENVDNIISSYISKEEIGRILDEYQKPLIPGTNISISEDNVISTYELLTTTDAASQYATINSLNDFTKHVINNYYDKTQTNSAIYSQAYYAVQTYIVKNAAEAFNDLEKISNWILEQPQSISYNFDLLDNRLSLLENIVGYSYYDETIGAYSYSSLVETVYNLTFITDTIGQDLTKFNDRVYDIQQKVNVSYDLSNSAYSYAYFAYSFLKADSSYAAYVMAYQSVLTIGDAGYESYFTKLTEEQISILNENPDAIEVYSIKTDNYSGIPLPDVYNKDSGLEYYTYTANKPATGFTKELINLREVSYNASEVAYNALYNLKTKVDGTSYVTLELNPEINDHTGVRTLVLELTEAEINELSGEIAQDGIITTYSLYNAFSYIFTPEFITTNQGS